MKAAGVGGVRDHRHLLLRIFHPRNRLLPLRPLPTVLPSRASTDGLTFSATAEVSFLNYENDPAGCLLYEKQRVKLVAVPPAASNSISTFSLALRPAFSPHMAP